MRFFEHADAPERRSGERAALVPEELALDELLRDRAAVDRDEFADAPTLIMQRARDELFARARFAAHEHRQVGWRETFELRAQRDHLRRGTHERTLQQRGLTNREPITPE